ncbi:MAG: sulfite exporter TauE/SafE family protein [Aestuariivita sp.]|uniref:sulfite exporter TauE/SafE family protein n=1 Tax=Aestuariivita sp. TaxID=1872407 RepID=UPI003BB20C3F
MIEMAGQAPAVLLLAFFITMAAGVVKGAVGFAMPLIMISGLSTVMDPKLALAAMIIPVLVSNGLQTFRQGLAEALSAAREYWRYLTVVCLSIVVVAQTVVFIPHQVFYLVLGVPIVTLCVVQLAGWRLQIAPERRRAAEWGIGLISGLLGGVAGIWGPTTVLYLMAINTTKARQMIVQGVIYGTGSVALVVAHLKSGLLNAETAPLSAMLVIPAFAGMWIGFRLQDRMDADLFRKSTLSVLIIAGLNLIRRGIIG